jgi:hypothetical protein
MAGKWANVLLGTFIPNWMEIWNRRRPRKEAGFMWTIYHGAVDGKLESQLPLMPHVCAVQRPHQKCYYIDSIIATGRLMLGNLPRLYYFDMLTFLQIEMAFGLISHGNNALLDPHYTAS